MTLSNPGMGMMRTNNIVRCSLVSLSLQSGGGQNPVSGLGGATAVIFPVAFLAAAQRRFPWFPAATSGSTFPVSQIATCRTRNRVNSFASNARSNAPASSRCVRRKTSSPTSGPFRGQSESSSTRDTARVRVCSPKDSRSVPGCAEILIKTSAYSAARRWRPVASAGSKKGASQLEHPGHCRSCVIKGSSKLRV